VFWQVKFWYLPKIQLCVKLGLVGSGILFRSKSLAQQKRPTKRAPDVWDSAAFSSIFHASSFSCSQAESQPAHTQVTQTVGWQSQRANAKPFFIRKFRFAIGSKIQNLFSGGVFSSLV
jgi:hypothetical protein